MDNYVLLLLLCLITFLLYLFRFEVANKLKIIDKPDSSRKIHKIPVPLLGGIIIFICYTISKIYFDLDVNFSLVKLFSFLLIVSIFFFIGLLDDIHNLSPTFRTITIIISLLIFLPFNDDFLINYLIFNSIELEVNIQRSSIFITIFCIFAFYNAINFCDGVNGVSLSYTLYIFLILFLKDQNFLYISIILINLIVLLFNLNNKVFLGNSGTSFISVFISLIIIEQYNTQNLLLCDEIFFILLFPGIDMVRVIFSRIKKNKKVYRPDNNHFHHFLHKRFKDKYTWVIYLIFSITPYILFIIIKNIALTFLLVIFYYFIFFRIFKTKSRYN